MSTALSSNAGNDAAALEGSTVTGAHAPEPTRSDASSSAAAKPAAAAAASARQTTVHLDARRAREVLLLRAYEAQNHGDQEDPLWTRADGQWATRVATETAGANASPVSFIEARAHAAMQRLAPRDEGVRRVLASPSWRWGWVAWTVLAALAIGAIVYDIGTHQRIDLLSAPVWVVVAWNLIVYVLLAVAFLRRLVGKGGDGGRLRRFIGARMASKVSGISRRTPALAHYASLWSRVSWPMTVARAGVMLHLGAAALALGLVGGMYLRGLVLDYRAGWQSTFLEAPTVHRWVSTALAPAAAVTGQAVPDEAAVTALRVTAGQDANGEAGGWIHLYAATLVLFVVLPRLLLALGSALRSEWLARRLPVNIDDPYHQRLLQQHLLSAARVRVHPHGAMPDATAALGLQRLISRVFGEKAELHLTPAAQYGNEESHVLHSALESDTVKLALFDLSATPELEAQGRFVQKLRERAPRGTSVVMMVDESAFTARFGLGERGAQRRAAWQSMAQQIGVSQPVFVNLGMIDLEGAASSLESALTQGEAALATA